MHFSWRTFDYFDRWYSPQHIHPLFPPLSLNLRFDWPHAVTHNLLWGILKFPLFQLNKDWWIRFRRKKQSSCCCCRWCCWCWCWCCCCRGCCCWGWGCCFYLSRINWNPCSAMKHLGTAAVERNFPLWIFPLYF